MTQRTKYPSFLLLALMFTAPLPIGHITLRIYGQYSSVFRRPSMFNSS